MSGIFKEPVAGPVWLGATNLVGDAQADLKHHGGPERAVNVYSADHFPDWRARLDRPDLTNGAFGENFTVAGLDEETVCIGDIFAIGDVRVQVTQPREPCWKLARKWNVKDLVKQVEQLRRTGWYMRVLQEGYVEAWPPDHGDRAPASRMAPRSRLRHLARPQDRPGGGGRPGACAALSSGWREALVSCRNREAHGRSRCR